MMLDPRVLPSFPETRWSRVLRARRADRRDDQAERALAELCEIYWLPLNAYARSCGHSPQDAEDLTQGFFRRLIERGLFAKADPARGRLRSFLLGAFKHFMSEQSRQASRQKRGSGQTAIPLHELQGEEVRANARAHSQTPEELFDRVWFDVMLEQALKELEREYCGRGKSELFLKLQDFLAWNRKDGRLAAAARDLDMSPGAVRVAILRMRQRFRELLERQIAETVGTPAEAAEELSHLRRVLGA